MPRGGIGDEETLEEKSKGPITYQEMKVFNLENFLCSVYDHPVTNVYTFEAYGLDTGHTFHLTYTQEDFDKLFRYNAELMNPNRKDGRFHYVIERLQIDTRPSGDQVLVKGEEISDDVPELPVYEKGRPIPTGPMDIKERQKLQNSMDMLKLKRDENIEARRMKRLKWIKKYIDRMKEDDKERKKLVDEKIAKERAQRQLLKDKIEAEEEQDRIRQEEKANVRSQMVDVKEERTAEQEEDELRQLRARWKENDAIKAKTIEEAMARKANRLEAQRKAEEKLQKKREDAQAKRQGIWDSLEKKFQEKNDEWMRMIREIKCQAEREAKLALLKNKDYNRDEKKQRQLMMAAAVERSKEREKARVAEEEATQKYFESRMLPRKINMKPRDNKQDPNTPSRTAKSPSNRKATADKDKSATDRVLDAVEAKMRQEIEEQRRRAVLDKLRKQAIEEIGEKWQANAVEHMKDVREAYRQNEEERNQQLAARRVIRKQRDEEKAAADDRRKLELERLQRVREQNIARKEAQRVPIAVG